MGLVRVLPQRVEHTDGWAVESAGRDAVRYQEPGRAAEIGIDRGVDAYRVHLDSLVWVDGAGAAIGPVERPENSLLIDRIVEGLEGLTEKAIELYRPEAPRS